MPFLLSTSFLLYLPLSVSLFALFDCAPSLAAAGWQFSAPQHNALVLLGCILFLLFPLFFQYIFFCSMQRERPALSLPVFSVSSSFFLAMTVSAFIATIPYLARFYLLLSCWGGLYFCVFLLLLWERNTKGAAHNERGVHERSFDLLRSCAVLNHRFLRVAALEKSLLQRFYHLDRAIQAHKGAGGAVLFCLTLLPLLSFCVGFLAALYAGAGYPFPFVLCLLSCFISRFLFLYRQGGGAVSSDLEFPEAAPFADDVEDLPSVNRYVAHAVRLRHPYRASYIVNGQSFTLEKGAVTSLLSRDRAGANHLLSVLAGQTRPLEGRFYMDGTDFQDMPSVRAARSRCLITKDDPLFPATVEENATLFNSALAPQAHRLLPSLGIGLVPDAEKQDLDRRLKVGLPVCAAVRQTILLARAILLNPPVLCLQGFGEDVPSANIEAMRRCLLDWRKDHVLILSTSSILFQGIADEYFDIDATQGKV